MKNSIVRFLKDEEGATAIEYGIIAGLMAVVLTLTFSSTSGIGLALTNIFNRIAGVLNTAVP